jgi:NADH dehydrogenase
VVAKPTALYKWILKVFIGDGSHPWQLFFAYCFRMVIVLGEVGIGLALFGGAFTFLASGVSLILCVMFLISGMATREIFWYLCAGLVLLGASGKAAGMDNWIIPFIDRLWRKSKLGRATKLYPDEPLTKRKR